VWAVAAALAVALAGVWLAWPGLPPLDAGDFVTASATVGVPHATGFPVYIEAARALMWLPFGNIASRAACLSVLLSGVAAGATVLAVARVLRLRDGSAAIAVAVGLVFLSATPLAQHARAAEVYALNIALVSIALVALEHLVSSGDRRTVGVIALCAGLGLANHALFALWAPVILIAAIALRRSNPVAAAPDARPSPGGGFPWRQGALVAWVLGLTGLAYAATLATAAGGPVHNWGDPSTLDRLWAHMTARDIRSAFGDAMTPNTTTLAVWSRVLAAELWSGLGLHLVLAGAGLLAMLRTGSHAVARVLALLLALEWIYAVALNPMGLRDAQNGQALALFLAAVSGGAIGLGVEALGRRGGVRRHLIASGAAAAAIACFIGASTPAPADARRDWSMEDLAALHLGFALPESISTATSDSMVAALLYSAVALDGRPDALVVGRHTLSDGAAAARDAAHGPAWWANESERRAWTEQPRAGGPVRALLAQVSRRPVYWEATGSGDELPTGFSLVHVWPMGRVMAAHDAARTDECGMAPGRDYCAAAPDVAWGAGARDRAGARNSAYAAWLARRWGYRGSRSLRLGRNDDAAASFERATQLAPDVSTWRTGFAVSLARLGALPEALAVQREAIWLDPLSVQARRNALEFADAVGDAEEATRQRNWLERWETRQNAGNL
jgi:hypothetical protein